MIHSDADALALDHAVPAPLLRPPLVTVKDTAEWLLGLKHLREIYAGARAGSPCDGFFRSVLRELGVEARVVAGDVDRIPASGPLVVVANHPFGAVEGIVLGEMVARVRPDVKLMANHLLGRIPELRERMILVDPFGEAGSAASNVRPLREAARWLAGGGALIVFPAGEVSSLSLTERRVADPEWSRSIARLVRLTGAAALPVYIDGRNDWLFQTAGLVHPRLRTALLPRALLKLRDRRIDLAIGRAIPNDRIVAAGTDAQVISYLRARTYALASRCAGVNARPPRAPRQAELVRADKPWVLRSEVAALPDEQRLLTSGDFDVLWGRASQIPRTLREIGRLREETFRTVGEGTGRSIDLDRFDDHYIHIFLWDRAAERVAGAYRLGKVDMILTKHGKAGLYTSTLFDYTPSLLRRLRPALEIGRAFVHADYQRSYSPLLLLWKGIGAFVAANPRYSILFGPISISSEYSADSRALICRYLERHHPMPELAAQVRARCPVGRMRAGRIGEAESDLLARDMTEAAWSISDMERDEKGMPVLIRQYLKLGARVLSFNVDRSFSNCIDALIIVDLTETDRTVLDRYMGSAEAGRFLDLHASHRAGRHAWH